MSTKQRKINYSSAREYLNHSCELAVLFLLLPEMLLFFTVRMA